MENYDTSNGLHGVLCGLPRRRVYFDPLDGGNNGDSVIVLGSHALHKSCGVDYVDRPSEADAVLVRGNGVLTHFYDHTPHRAAIQHYIDTYPEIPVIVEPSTYYLPSQPVFRVPAGRAPVVLFARGASSLELESGKLAYSGLPVSFGIDHDMAFHLRGSEFVQRLSGRAAEHALIVERFDIENPARSLHRSSKARRIASVLSPGPLKQMVRPVLSQLRGVRSTPFKSEAELLLARRGLQAERHRSGDISRSDSYSFDEFTRLIAQSSMVVTQRLHVGILAALLGKETWLDDRGYFKIREIYEHSMRQMGHVHLMSRERLS